MVRGMTVHTTLTQGSIFSWADAMLAGMTRRQGNRLAPQRVIRGFYAMDEPYSFHNQVRAVLRAAGPMAMVCGVTSLRVAGVDLPWRLDRDQRIWIQVPKHQNWPRRPGVRLVRSDRDDQPVMVQGLPSLSLPYVWLQLAAHLSIDELVEVADALTRRHNPMTTKVELGMVIDLRLGARGVARAREALELSAEGTDSLPETDLRLLVVRANLPTPIVNLPVVDDSGRVIHILDLAYKKPKVAIEYDGAYHVSDRLQMQQDAARRRHLEDLGWRIITVTSADLANDPAGVIASIRRALQRSS